MKKYIIKRLITSFMILLGISIVMFFILHISPGNPYMDFIKKGMTPEQIESMLISKGYYDNIFIKFLKWFVSIIRLDLGYSIKYNMPVKDLIFEKIPFTLFLTVPSLIISIVLSIIVGRYTAYHKNFFDKLIDFFSQIGISTPTFLIAIFFIKIFCFDFKIFPVSGTGSYSDINNFDDFLYSLHHAILPIIVLSVINFSSFVRYVRGFMISIQNQQYILSYQGFGMTRYEAYKIIGFRNIVPRIITIIFMEIPSLISGALITESIFVWPGVGKLNYDAVFSRDYPLVMGIIVIMAFIVLISNLSADILNQYLDKRIGIL